MRFFSSVIIFHTMYTIETCFLSFKISKLAGEYHKNKKDIQRIPLFHDLTLNNW